MGRYRRMTWVDRLKIEALYNTNHTYQYIAKATGFAVSSIHREVQHGLYPHMGAELTRRPMRYSAQIAQDYADAQATSHGVAIKLGHNYAYAQAVSQMISMGCSPDVIVSTFKRKGEWTVSTPTLYRYIDLGYIPNVTNADLQEKPRRIKRKKRTVRAARPPKGASIERRPSHINHRLTFGHWEMDSVIGRAEGQAESLLVFTERKTRFEIIVRTKAKTSAATVRALEYTLSKFPKGTFKSITVDNGSEFQDCYGMEHDKKGNKRLQIYYCHPYCSSERGSNERANRIIRRYFPKGRSLSRVTQKRCDEVAHLINTMPRKILNYATAEELFLQEIAALTP